MRGPGVQPRWRANPHTIFFLTKWINSWTSFFSSKVAKFTWKMRNVLKRMQIIFAIFIFWDMAIFILKNWSIFDEFWVQKQSYLRNYKSENGFFTHFSTFRIFHVNLATFEEKKFVHGFINLALKNGSRML